MTAAGAAVVALVALGTVAVLEGGRWAVEALWRRTRRKGRT